MRVIAGRLRSRALLAPKGEGTRPTSDRVKEAMFSMLQSRVGMAELRVLDLFAGSGALGIEALSRGAAQVLFVERAPAALRALRQNLAALSLESQSLVWQGDARALAQRAEALRFELVLLDPPYRALGDGELARVLAAWAQPIRGAVLLLEHSGRDVAPEFAGYTLVSHRRYGDTALALYEPGASVLSDLRS